MPHSLAASGIGDRAIFIKSTEHDGNVLHEITISILARLLSFFKLILRHPMQKKQGERGPWTLKISRYLLPGGGIRTNMRSFPVTHGHKVKCSFSYL